MTNKSRILTYEILKRKGACSDQLALFRYMVGSEIAITKELCTTHCDKFDWNWAAHHLLNTAAFVEFSRINASAWAEYEGICTPAWAEYERASGPSWREYENMSEVALAEVMSTRASAMAKYKRIDAPACAEYKRTIASAWAEFYISDTVP